jgi:hypothetical protein
MKMSSTARVLREAIESQTIIEIFYPPGRRKVQPLVLGFSSKGDELVRAFQLEGASKSGEHTNWKLFRVDEVQSISLTSETFVADHSEYNPNDKAMKGGIIARVPKKG